MSQTATSVLLEREASPSASESQLLQEPAPVFERIASFEIEDDSPFGLQGLARETLQIIKPNCITKLAITLAMRGTRAQIRDVDFVKRILSYNVDWIDEYQVVHLIERSLWIQGHSDLVMTMTKNPSQIPDNPPKKIMQALARANALHPNSTIWYGVPLFSDDKNEDGLPIPVTATQVHEEAARRIAAAQKHALRWGWMYRAIFGLVRLPKRIWRGITIAVGHVRHVIRRIANYWKQARRDARRRERAIYVQELERCRDGFSHTVIPEHTTFLGRTIDTAGLALELLAYQASFIAYAAPLVGAAGIPLGIASFAPILFTPVPLVLCDPFLFIELPGEPGKLRHLGHWYWQTQPKGRQKLHLHV